MWLLLFINLFAECDIIVDRLELVKTKEIYINTFTDYKVEGVFYFDDKEFSEFNVRYETIWSNRENDFLRFITVSNDKYVKSCDVDYNVGGIVQMEDAIIDCVCEHSALYYLLEKIYKNSNWSYPSPAWRR